MVHTMITGPAPLMPMKITMMAAVRANAIASEVCPRKLGGLADDGFGNALLLNELGKDRAEHGNDHRAGQFCRAGADHVAADRLAILCCAR